MKVIKTQISLIIIFALLFSMVSPAILDKSYGETLNNLILGTNITEWTLDEETGYIYAVSSEANKLWFIDYKTMQISKEILIGSQPSDIEIYNNKLYIPLSGSTQIAVVDIATKAKETNLTVANIPYRVAIDNDKLYYVKKDGIIYIYAYDLIKNTEQKVTITNDIYKSYSNPDIEVDRVSHVIYIGESGSSGSDIEAVSTLSYERIHRSTYDEGYGFSFPNRKVILDGEDVFYAGHRFAKNNLGTIEGRYQDARFPYNEKIVSVNGNYVFTENAVYDREKYVMITTLPFSTNRLIVDGSNTVYLFNQTTKSIEKASIDLQLIDSKDYFNLGNKLDLKGRKIFKWLYDDTRNYIYAISMKENKLLFINPDTMMVEEEIYVGSQPSDIEMTDGKLYIPLFGGNYVAVVDIASKAVIEKIKVNQNPYAIAIDGNKLFYVSEDQHLRLYEHDLSIGNTSEKEIKVLGDTYTSYYEADLEIDRINHVLYIGESGSSGSDIEAISTIDYQRLSKSSTSFSFPNRKVILDRENVYYAGRRFNKDNLATIEGRYQDASFTYNEKIVCAKGDYIITENAVYNRDTYSKIFDLTSGSEVKDLRMIDKNGKLYVYYQKGTSTAIYSFDFVEQYTQPYPQNFRAVFNTAGELELSWNPVAGAEGYNIYFELESEPSRPIKINSEPITEARYIISDFNSDWYGEKIYFGATAMMNGQESTISVLSSKLFTVQAPMNFTIEYESVSEAVYFGWDPVPNIDGYNIYYKLLSEENYTKLNDATITEAVYTENKMDIWADNIVEFGIKSVRSSIESDLTKAAFDFKSGTAIAIPKEEPPTSSEPPVISDNNEDSGSSVGRDRDTSSGTVDNSPSSQDSLITERETIENGIGTIEVTVNENILDQLIENGEIIQGEITIDVEGSNDRIVVQLPGSSYHKLNGKGEGKKIVIRTENGVYILPANAIDLSGFKSDINQTTIIVEVTKVTEQNMKHIFADRGIEIVGEPVEFTIKVVSGGASTEIKSFGTQYIERRIPLLKLTDKRTTVGVLYDEIKKSFVQVPTTFYKDEKGKDWAVVKRNGNSTYAVVNHKKSFTDIEKHWAKENIELLASKLIVKGIDGSSFAPNKNITRAEYVTLLTKALGLTSPNQLKMNFKDVSGTDWYAEGVQIAVEMGLVSGYDDNTFRPEQPIKRQEIAVMTVRALEMIQGKQDEYQNQLNFFADASAIDEWAKGSVEKALNVGLMVGKTEENFEPNDYSTRAEAATLLKNLLYKLSFIEY